MDDCYSCSHYLVCRHFWAVRKMLTKDSAWIRNIKHSRFRDTIFAVMAADCRHYEANKLSDE